MLTDGDAFPPPSVTATSVERFVSAVAAVAGGPLPKEGRVETLSTVLVTGLASLLLLRLLLLYRLSPVSPGIPVPGSWPFGSSH